MAPNESPTPTSRRLFVGIALDAASRAACAAAVDAFRRAGFAARFEEPEKFHVTLAFLGNVDPVRYEDVVAAMRRAAVQTRPFELTLDKTGAFPHERKPRIVYVGARVAGPEFRRLGGAVRGAYEHLGFLFDKDAVAHVTIARVKDPRRPLPLVDVAPAQLRVERLVLFESLFDKERNTSRYLESALAELDQ